MASSPAAALPVARREWLSRTAAFFDLDRTMVAGSSMYPLAVALCRAGFLRSRDLVRFAAAQGIFRLSRREARGNIDRACATSLKTIAGRSRDELLAIADDVIHETLAARLFEEAVAQVEEHIRGGDLVFIVTSSSEDLAVLLARHLGADGALGTQPELIDGRYTGLLPDGLNHGVTKARRVRAFAYDGGIDLTRSVVYTDSINDLPLLRLAGRPVAVNPDRQLRRVAKRMRWSVQTWRRPLGSSGDRCRCTAGAKGCGTISTPA
jgi:HAD superfamily hydrolase (TIGR01490 family)